jgi:signal transduction histidine kinase
MSAHTQDRRLRLGRLESLSALAGGITHELNNLAASVMMSVQVLEPCCQHVSDRQVLASLDELANRLQHAGRQLHWLARGIDGEATMFQPQYLITDLQRLARVAFPASIAVVTRYPPDLWPLAGDPLIVFQLLVALCLEARYRLPEEGTLVLSASNQELAGDAGPQATAAGALAAATAHAGGNGRPAGRYVVLEAIAETPAPGALRDPAAQARRRRAGAEARRAAAAAGGFVAPGRAGAGGSGRRAWLPAAGTDRLGDSNGGTR